MVEETMFSGESKNIEYKVSLPDKNEKYMKTIVAFANTQGGKLIVGVDDKTHQIVGNMDSQAPNKVVGEWLAKQGYDYIKPEFTYGKSRIDFYMEKGEQKYLLEVKGCTLEVDGIGYFPDAPTERGVKHLHELAQAQQAGYRCAVAFVIQMEGITEVRPNVSTQPEFGTALAEAKAAGVRVLFLLCHVGRDSLEIVEQREG